MEPVVRSIINPKRGMEVPPQPTPVPPQSCSGGAKMGDGNSCISLDMRLAVFLVMVAGVIVLLLLYRLLQLRHRLRMARATHALEYYGFYHSATYRLRHAPLLTTKNGLPSDSSPLPLQTVTSVMPPAITVTLPPLPCPPPVIPPIAPSLPPPPPPVAQAIPPSPHLSWGACSDVEVYSRIGAFRASRLSSLSSQSRIILFEHSSL